MLDAARITLADHRTYDLSGFYIVCTSNIGSQQLLRPTRLPFTTLERAVISELHRFFRPELIGRFDEKIVFRPLSPDTQREIVRLAIAEELARFRERGFDLTVSDDAFEFLVRRGIHKALGARPMKKTVQKFIGDAVRDAIKSGAPSSGVLTVSPLNDRLMIRMNTGASKRSSDFDFAFVSYYTTIRLYESTFDMGLPSAAREGLHTSPGPGGPAGLYGILDFLQPEWIGFVRHGDAGVFRDAAGRNRAGGPRICHQLHCLHDLRRLIGRAAGRPIPT